MNACKPPSVSVVVPLYNKGPFVERAIGSVLAQTFQDFAIVVVDDGSTDDGPGIVERISDPRIRLISQSNAGVSAARNRGIREAKSSLIAFLDADDEWQPGFLAAIVSLRRSYPEAGAYATGYMIADKRGKCTPFRPRRLPRSDWTGILPDYFRLGIGCVWSSAVAVTVSAFAKAGLFREGVAFGEDLDMWFRIAARFDIAYCPQALAVWHMDASSRACDRTHDISSPLRLSLAELENDMSVGAATREKASKYVERQELSLIMYLCRTDGRLRRDKLMKWRQEYGACWKWCVCYAIACLPQHVVTKVYRW